MSIRSCIGAVCSAAIARVCCAVAVLLAGWMIVSTPSPVNATTERRGGRVVVHDDPAPSPMPLRPAPVAPFVPPSQAAPRTAPAISEPRDASATAAPTPSPALAPRPDPAPTPLTVEEWIALG
jgi:hypothetical protein